MPDVFLREKVVNLLEDRKHRYEDMMEDPDDLTELIRLIVADADRAHRLDRAVLEKAGKKSSWSPIR